MASILYFFFSRPTHIRDLLSLILHQPMHSSLIPVERLSGVDKGLRLLLLDTIHKEKAFQIIQQMDFKKLEK